MRSLSEYDMSVCEIVISGIKSFWINSLNIIMFQGCLPKNSFFRFWVT